MNTPSILLEPNEYKGWFLSWAESHDNKNNFRAQKGAAFLFAAQPKELIAKIDEAETVTVKLKKPIKALWRDQYGHSKREVVEIHSLIRDCVYFTLESGEERYCWLKDLKPEEKNDRKFIQCCPHNDRILKKHQKMVDKIRFMNAMNEELLKSLKLVTDADVILAAKG